MMGTRQMAREARYGMGWPLARTLGWVRGSCVVPAAVKAGEPGERHKQRGRRGQISPGSGQDVAAWQWVRCQLDRGTWGGGGWPLGPTGAIDVNSSRLPCNQLARLDPALAWLLCGKRVYFCLPSWAGVCRWVRRVRCGEMGRRGETRGEGPRGRAARGLEPEEWRVPGVVCRQDAFASSRQVATQAREQRETRDEREGLGESRSVAPPDRRDASRRRRGSVKKERKKGARGRWYSDSQVFFLQ